VDAGWRDCEKALHVGLGRRGAAQAAEAAAVVVAETAPPVTAPAVETATATPPVEPQAGATKT
jgi:hypothetical protein